MAKVEWNDAVKTVSGALVKINKKSQHAADQKMVLATHRTAATTSNACSRLYLRGLSAITRSTKPKAKELAARSRFTEVGNAVRLRAKDLMQIAADQAAFLAQKDTAGGIKTMKAYYWHICGEEYDQQHGN